MPANKELITALVAIGQFKPYTDLDGGVWANYWSREIPEEGSRVEVGIPPGMNVVTINIQPAVATFDGHHSKRISAGVMFEMATRYAEKVNGTITQLANVDTCVGQDGTRQHLIAQYPETPLQYQQLCEGWQDVFIRRK